MSREAAVLAIDLGTSSVKALVVDANGQLIGRGTRAYPVHRPEPGAAEQDPEEWWTATCAAVRDACAGVPATRIKAIGLSGQMHGTVLLDSNHKPLRPAVIWEDTRAADLVRHLERRLGRKRFIEIAGSRPAAGFQAITVRWVQREEPVLWRNARHLFLPKDYLRFRLSGEFVSEPSDASSSVLLDVRRRAWSGQLLEDLEIDRSMLPAIESSNTPSATLSSVAASALGLSAGVPIAGGAGDAPAAALATGGADPKTLLLTISSGSQAILPSPTAAIDPQGRLHSWCHCLNPESGAGWYVMAATMASGLAVRWLRENVLGASMATTYEAMEEEVARVPPGSGGLVFVPYLLGERTPHFDPAARAMFIGLTASHGREHLIRSVMEGSAFALWEACQVLVELGGSPDRIVLTGGGARSATWTAIVADLFDLPVSPCEEADGSAMGAAILAGSSIGWFRPEVGSRNWQRLADPVFPNEETTSIYRQLFPIYQRAYQLHRRDFPSLRKLGQAS